MPKVEEALTSCQSRGLSKFVLTPMIFRISAKESRQGFIGCIRSHFDEIFLVICYRQRRDRGWRWSCETIE